MSKTIRYPELVAILMESKISKAAERYLDSGEFREEDYHKHNIFQATANDKPFVKRGQTGILLSRTDEFLVMIVSYGGEMTPIETGFDWVDTGEKFKSWDDLTPTGVLSDKGADILSKDITSHLGLPIEPHAGLEDFDDLDEDELDEIAGYRVYYQDAPQEGPVLEQYPGAVGLWVVIDASKGRHILVAVNEDGNIVGSSPSNTLNDINRFESVLLKAGYHPTEREEWPDFIFYNDIPW